MTETVGDIIVDPTVAPAADPPADRTFTQADVDRIVQERLARAKSTPPDDYEDLKAKAAKLAEIEEANKTELERERDRATQAEARAAQIEADAREARKHAALVAEAAKPGRNIIDIDAAIALLDESSLELDDAGVPTNIADAMDSLLQAKPFLIAANGGTRGNADQGARDHGGVKQVTDAELKTMTPEAIDQAHREGRLKSLLGP